MKPPNWDEDQAPRLRGVSIFFIAFTTLVIVTRLASQLQVHRKLFWDDGWLSLGLVFMLAVQGVNLWGLDVGLGKHASRVMIEDKHPPSSFITLWKVGFLNSIFIYCCLYSVKVSLLLLYKRLFWIARWFRIAWYANLVYATLWVISMTLTAIFQCTPVNYAWNRMYLLTHIPAPFKIEGHCLSYNFVTAAASLSLASDVGIWLLPMVVIFKLQMTTKRKVEMGLLLSLGLIAVACGVVKTIIGTAALTSQDVSWANAPLASWASAEQAVGILCAAIPVIVGDARAIRAVRRSKRVGHSAYYDHGTKGSSGAVRSAASRGTGMGKGGDDSMVSADSVELEKRGAMGGGHGAGRGRERWLSDEWERGVGHARELSQSDMRRPKRGADFV